LKKPRWLSKIELLQSTISQNQRDENTMIRQTVLPFKLENTKDIDDIISPFLRRMSSRYIGLTPAQIQVANLVRQGKRTKDIAGLLDLSLKTIEDHRKNLRKILGLRNKKANLRTHLLSVQ